MVGNSVRKNMVNFLVSIIVRVMSMVLMMIVVNIDAKSMVALNSVNWSNGK